MKKISFIILLLIATNLGFALHLKQDIKKLNPVLEGIHPQCQRAMFEIATTTSFFKCVPLQELLIRVPVLTDSIVLNEVLSDPHKNYKFIEEPLVGFADSFCSAPRCSEQEISEFIEVMTAGCKPDMSGNPLLQIIYDATVYYHVLKDVICFKNGKTYCWDETVSTIINLPPSPLNVTGSRLIDSVAVADTDKVCTKCNKDIVNTFFNFTNNNDLAQQVLKSFNITDDNLKNVELGIAVKCGINFEEFLS